VRKEGGLDPESYDGVGDKWPDAGCILKTNHSEFLIISIIIILNFHLSKIEVIIGTCN
jgi:hypothetical protein